MLMRLACVLVTCAFLSTPTGGGPNQVPPTRDDEVAIGALRPSGPNEPVPESEQGEGECRCPGKWLPLDQGDSMGPHGWRFAFCDIYISAEKG